jgi:hypothetical protein
MTRNRYQLWTSDMVIGAAIVIIGIVATLVRYKVIEMRWTVTPPPMVSHLWPLLLIGSGVLLLSEREEHSSEDHSLRTGDRQ